MRFLLACFILLATLQIYGAATLRGQLNRKLPNGTQTPAAGITVTVLSQAKVRSSQAVTQQDGMFYLNNLPAGSYSLEVSGERDGERTDRLSHTSEGAVHRHSTD